MESSAARSFDFGQYIRDARKAAGHTIQQVADRCGVSAEYLSQIETGKKPTPSEEVCDLLADALGLNADFLLWEATLRKVPAIIKGRVVLADDVIAHHAYQWLAIEQELQRMTDDQRDHFFRVMAIIMRAWPRMSAG